MVRVSPMLHLWLDSAVMSLLSYFRALLKQRSMMTELHFREVRNGVALSPSGSPVVVDVACNENVFEMLDKEEKVEGKDIRIYHMYVI